MTYPAGGGAARPMRAAADHARATSPAHQAYQILHWGFVALPIIAGLDKYFMLLADWHVYLAPFFTNLVPGHHTFMYVVGAVEIAAGLLVAFKPRIGGYVVAAWLWAIIVNLLMIPGYYDIALRDFGLSLGALALARLATEFAVAPEGDRVSA